MRICYIIIFLLIQFSQTTFGENSTDSILLGYLRDAVKEMELGNYEYSLQQFNKIEKTAENERRYRVLAITLLNKGITFYSISENEKALNLYFEALEFAKKHNIKEVLNSIYNNIAIIYSNNNNHKKAKEYFINALDISKLLNDDYKTGINLLNLANLESDLGNYNTALDYVALGSDIFTKIDDKKKLAALYNIEGLIYLQQEKYLNAKNKQLQAYSIEKELGDPVYLSNIALQLGTAYQKLGFTDSSLVYLNESLEIAKNINNKETQIQALIAIANIHKNKGKLKQALQLYDKSLNLKDSLLSEKNQKWVSEIQMKYEFNKKVQEIDYLNRRNKLYLIILVLSISTITTIAFFILYSFRLRNIKIQQKNELLNKEKTLRELEFQKTEAENKCLSEEIKANEEKNKMKQEQLHKELEHKNRELTSNALHVVNKNAILQDIQAKIKKFSPSNIQNIDATIKNILNLINTNLNLDSDWDTFKLHFEKVHGEFFDKILNDYPSLSQNDLRLCAYILINLSPKEIAQIFNISPDSIRKRKQRLREKLDLETEVDMSQFLAKYK